MQDTLAWHFALILAHFALYPTNPFYNNIFNHHLSTNHVPFPSLSNTSLGIQLDSLSLHPALLQTFQRN